MKHLAAACLMAISSLAVALEQEPVKLPKQLSCKYVTCISDVNPVKGKYCDGLREMVKTPAILATKYATQPKDTNRVKISLSESEEINDYQFTREELAELNLGKRKTVRGTRTIGYWWADGDHVEEAAVVSCKKVK